MPLLDDKSKVFNTARIEALELDNLMEVGNSHCCICRYVAQKVAVHMLVYDYPERDDKNWLKHTLFCRWPFGLSSQSICNRRRRSS